MDSVTSSPTEGVYPHYISCFTRAHLVKTLFTQRLQQMSVEGAEGERLAAGLACRCFAASHTRAREADPERGLIR